MVLKDKIELSSKPLDKQSFPKQDSKSHKIKDNWSTLKLRSSGNQNTLFWKKIPAMLLSDKGLLFRIKKKKTDYLMGKWAK